MKPLILTILLLPLAVMAAPRDVFKSTDVLLSDLIGEGGVILSSHQTDTTTTFVVKSDESGLFVCPFRNEMNRGCFQLVKDE